MILVLPWRLHWLLKMVTFAADPLSKQHVWGFLLCLASSLSLLQLFFLNFVNVVHYINLGNTNRLDRACDLVSIADQVNSSIVRSWTNGLNMPDIFIKVLNKSLVLILAWWFVQSVLQLIDTSCPRIAMILTESLLPSFAASMLPNNLARAASKRTRGTTGAEEGNQDKPWVMSYFCLARSGQQGQPLRKWEPLPSVKDEAARSSHRGQFFIVSMTSINTCFLNQQCLDLAGTWHHSWA